MSDEFKDIDVNDAFEKILLAEDLAEKAAYEEGFATGKNQMLEGFHLGYHRASSVAAQLGYYFGVLIFVQQTCNIPKIIEQTRKLMEDIQKFPTDNDDAIDIFEKFDSIKLNFKKICSLAKIDATYSEENKLDF